MKKEDEDSYDYYWQYAGDLSVFLIAKRNKCVKARLTIRGQRYCFVDSDIHNTLIVYRTVKRAYRDISRQIGSLEFIAPLPQGFCIDSTKRSTKISDRGKRPTVKKCYWIGGKEEDMPDALYLVHKTTGNVIAAVTLDPHWWYYKVKDIKSGDSKYAISINHVELTLACTYGDVPPLPDSFKLAFHKNNTFEKVKSTKPAET
jgi:hypothetical protein